MKTRRRSWVLALAAGLSAMLAGASGARGAGGEGACPSPRDAAPGAGPVPAGIGPADFGMVPEACPATELLGRVRATALLAIPAPDYYGFLGVGAMLRGRYLLPGGRWVLSLAADLVTYNFVANAVVQSGAVAVGPPTVGVLRALSAGPDAAWALYARLLLPLESMRQNSSESGVEAGASGRVRVRERLFLQGGAALAAPVVVTGRVWHPAFRPGLLLEAAFVPRAWVALLAGASARFQAAPDPSLLALAPRLGARFALRRGMALAAVVEVPLAGSDRTDFVASVFVGWTPH